MQFKELLSELRRAYDYVVVDAAAVFESADADVVSECADGVLVTARRRASAQQPRRAIEQLSPQYSDCVLLDT